jgi:DNA-binding CsgD family transcriptional regulator/PAS domain-containing protein
MQSSTMDQEERLSTLIGEIYDAALDHEHWPTVLRHTADFVGGYAATIFAKEVTRHEGFVAYESGEIGEENRKSYFEHYIKLDPSFTAQFFGEIGEPMSTVDMVPYEEFVQSRFFLEWAKPQGLVDFIASVLDKSLTSAALFGVFRHQRDGIVDDETRRRMRLVIPHIRRAVLVGRLIDLKDSEAATLATVLDQIKFGVLLVDATGHVVHANDAANVMLARNEPLRVVDGKLMTSDVEIDNQFQQVFTAASHGDKAIGTAGISVVLARSEQMQFIAHVMPLTAGNRTDIGTKFKAVAAVFVREAHIDVASPPKLIAQTFKLTPTELRIMLAIVEVGGVPEVATALGIAESTVKTHLGRLYEKTGAKRQADLVKIFAGYTNPLVL